MVRALSSPSGIYDEMFEPSRRTREHYKRYRRWLNEQDEPTLKRRVEEANVLFRRYGITFNVYGEAEGTERLIPFDIVPRIIPAHEWEHLLRGMTQRVRALNLFLHDIYHERNIIRARVVPADEIFPNDQYQPAMIGLTLPGRVYSHITGVDLIRNNDAEWYVLEDNLRTPSGVSYMLENRKMMMRLFPELFRDESVLPVEHYPNTLLHTLSSLSQWEQPTVVVLTPGRFNSAYFEHSFLAQQMGVQLVEGADLFVQDSFVYMRTTTGPRRVDVIYRRIDDAFLDPLAFRADSMLGVPGLLSVYRAGNVILANAIGTGVADDKSIYSYVPDMIRFYLDEEPVLRNVPTWRCREREGLKYTLEHLNELVVKEVHGAGGYGMLIGPKASDAELAEFRTRIRNNPANYIAQPTLSLSTCPTLVEEGVAPRHIDLRPYVLCGFDEINVVPGGLTRVALQKGSLVVNSSQGGGTKDTWVLDV